MNVFTLEGSRTTLRPGRALRQSLTHAIRMEIRRVTGIDDTLVHIFEGRIPEVVVMTSAPAHPALIGAVDRIVQAELRGHRRDFVHARVRFIQSSPRRTLVPPRRA